MKTEKNKREGISIRLGFYKDKSEATFIHGSMSGEWAKIKA